MHAFRILPLLFVCSLSSPPSPPPPPSCPHHAKSTETALMILTSTSRCGFLSISFSPSIADTVKLATALTTTTSVASFYVAPEFILRDDSDGRLNQLLHAMNKNNRLPIKTLGLWHESSSHCTAATTRLFMSSLQALLTEKTGSTKITGISIPNQFLETADILTTAKILSTNQQLRSLSIKVRAVQENDISDKKKMQRDDALALVFQTLGAPTSALKTLSIEPHTLVGSIGVGTVSSSRLSNSLITNPGTLLHLELKGVLSWKDTDLAMIFRGIQNSGRGE